MTLTQIQQRVLALPHGVLIRAAVLAAIVLSTAPRVHADDFLDQVNSAYENGKVPASKQSNLVMIPLWADMEEPPASVAGNPQHAMLLLPGMSDWDQAEAWAMGEPQRAVLEGLRRVTEADNFRSAMVFAQPYGAAGVPPEHLAAELYTELGEDTLLARAEHLYLPSFVNTGVLVHIEATRLNDNQDTLGAINLLTRWLLFARQMADRTFFEEKLAGMRAMSDALTRIRDIAYIDWQRGEDRVLSQSEIVGLIESLDEVRIIGIERIALPQGDFIAAEQLINRVMIPRAGTNPDTFAPIIAELGVEGNPLRLFAEASYWEKVRNVHAGWEETVNRLRLVRGDWTTRWDLPPEDLIHTRFSDYTRYVQEQGERFAIIKSALPDIAPLYPLRRQLRVELAGTRQSLALYGFILAFGANPPDISSPRPQFIKEIERDPYSEYGSRTLGYQRVLDGPTDPVTGRKIKRILVWGSSESVWPDSGLGKFEIPLDDTHAILYSVGPDARDQFMVEMTQGDPGLTGDYILWPPSIAIVRQRLIETGRLR